MQKFEFETWKDYRGTDPVQNFLDEKLNGDQRLVVLEKIEHYEKLSILELGRENTLKKIRVEKILQELKFRRPPIRMLGVLRETKYIACHSFFKDYNGAIKQKEIKTALQRALQID